MPIPPRLVIAASQVLWHHSQPDKGRLWILCQHFTAVQSAPCSGLSTFRYPYLYIYLQAALWPCMLDTTCNSVRTFIVRNFTHPHIHRNYTAAAFLPPIRLEPFIRGFVSLKRHSHHGYFIDLRHIICIACLQAGFHSG